MFVKDVFTSVAKAFSRWFRPKTHTKKCAVKVGGIAGDFAVKRKGSWGKEPDARRRLLAVFFQINKAAEALQGVMGGRREGRETKGLADVRNYYSVDPEPRGAYSLFYPYYLQLWSQPIYYQCHFLVSVTQHRISMRPRFSRLLSVISEGSLSSHEDLGVLRAIDTTHSSYFSSDSEELLSDSH